MKNENMELLRKRIQLINEESHLLRVKKIMTYNEMLKELFNSIPTLKSFQLTEIDPDGEFSGEFMYLVEEINGFNGDFSSFDDNSLGNESLDLLVKTDITQEEMKYILQTINSFDGFFCRLLFNETLALRSIHRENVLNNKLLMNDESYLSGIKAVNNYNQGDKLG